ncbi:tyrosine-type recombinase/integrase [Olsenella sp. YH-ols2217]|uniref:Tyrosine-type recombinase/integrase n=1 Tax=Kribbibacterium absianum TaxID=3044210 RepID=A0ABT6ZIS5_9ACTN|nr:MULTISPECIES: tyrosine-type recombinase/integrase [unclassified Olsenella]MDJ1121466.1 tyrosine-type recombinase/integrase [Olsenella sp. YH-ols2216]MDJ1128956.1 tyrosine-type recombinase/integrase [Olsenella sp. YH-ols2217]
MSGTRRRTPDEPVYEVPGAPAPSAEITRASGPFSSSPTDEELFEAWEAELNVRSENTLRTYKSRVRRWQAWVNEQGLGLLEPRRSEVIVYRDKLHEEGMEAASVNQNLVSIRSFYRWALSYGLAPDITAGVPRLKTSNLSSRGSLTKEQVLGLLDFETLTEKDRRDYAILNLMVRRGLRDVEISRAKVRDLRQTHKGPVLMVWGKGRDAADQPVPLSEEVVRPIRDYLWSRGNPGPKEPLFASVSNNNRGGAMTTRAVSAMVSQRMRDAGIDTNYASAHWLRHTAVTFGLLEGGPDSIRHMQQMARHANVETTARYAHDLQLLDGTGGNLVDSYLDDED